MDKDILIFHGQLIIKQHLLKLPTNVLKETYSEDDYFTYFIESINILLEREIGFLFLDDSIEKKIFEVLANFKFSNDEVLVDAINEITRKLNEIVNMPPFIKKMMKATYINYQQDVREVQFCSLESFLNAICYDAIFYYAIENSNFEILYNDNFSLTSCNYFLKKCPIIFKDKCIRDNTLKILDELNGKTNLFSSKKRFVKNLKKDLTNID